jgi:hypothetical protein|tara:strand:+ start:432 stop:656 length:225 start_codon:yes stop_codon:yes gene_type:complete
LKLEGSTFKKNETDLDLQRQKKNKMIKALAIDVANFLARGGKIQRIGKGVMAIDVTKTDHKERDYRGRLENKRK